VVTDEVVASLRDELVGIVGASDVIVSRDRLVAYERDWTGNWEGRALLAVRPATAREVAGVLVACSRARVTVVVHGGNTGLVGGATPDSDVVLDTTRLDQLGDVDNHSFQVTVGAGVTLERAQGHARVAGLDLPVDLGARSGATIGGMVATNAGGRLAVRYGTMRTSVCGLEAVLSTGRIIERLSGVLKDNAGYDLPALIVGSEGTLAVVTRVRLQLLRRPARRAAALVGARDYREAVALVSHLRARLSVSLEAADCFDRTAMEAVCAYLRVSDPLSEPHHVYVILQVAEPNDDPAATLAAAVDPELLDAMVIAEDTARRRALWTYREALNEAVGAQGIARKYDISVPIAAIPAFAEDARQEVERRTGATATVYGHLGDGNLHVNVLGTSGADDGLDVAMADLVAAHNGSISAEHGIGRAKRSFLGSTRSSAEIEAMWAVKRALDPTETLGRGCVLPPWDEPAAIERSST
jgi:FAD/FMN-containing dehydrogenase